MSIDFSNSDFDPQEMEEPLVTTSLTREDENEYSLRPKTLREYIGQEKAKGNLEVFIQAAKMRREPLDHVLLHGPPGLGKTTLSGIIANEMGVNVRVTSGPAIEKAGDLAALLTNLNENDILFVDEIHRLNRQVEEILYPAMEDYVIDIIIGKGPSANSVRLDLPKFTLIGATTRAGQLSAPLRDRFGVTLRLELYTPEELALIHVGKWGMILNYSYIPADEADAARHKKLLADYRVSDVTAYMSQFYPAIKREIVASWDRLFDERIQLGGSHQYGIIWELRKEWIMDVIQ